LGGRKHEFSATTELKISSSPYIAGIPILCVVLLTTWGSDLSNLHHHYGQQLCDKSTQRHFCTSIEMRHVVTVFLIKAIRRKCYIFQPKHLGEEKIYKYGFHTKLGQFLKPNINKYQKNEKKIIKCYLS
jgi:hypothetical protein